MKRDSQELTEWAVARNQGSCFSPKKARRVWKQIEKRRREDAVRKLMKR